MILRKPAYEFVWSGPDRVCIHETATVAFDLELRHYRDVREIEWEKRVGRIRRDDDRIRAIRCGARHRREVIADLGFRIRCGVHDRVSDVLRRHGPAVLKPDALAQFEAPTILSDDLPTGDDVRQRLAAFSILDRQRIEDVTLPGERRVLRAHDRVERNGAAIIRDDERTRRRVAGTSL